MSSTSTTEKAGLSLLSITIAAPGIVLILVTALLLLGLPFGFDPLWHVEPLTLAEAAALHDKGEVVRLIRTGANPNQSAAVRADFLQGAPLVITPLEAAVGADRADVLEVLLDNGAVMDAAIWTRLMCFATDIEADEALSFLEQHPLPGASESCDQIQRPW